MSKKKHQPQSMSEQLTALLKDLAGDIFSQDQLNALTQDLLKTDVENALGAEMGEHLGYEKHAPEGRYSAMRIIKKR